MQSRKPSHGEYPEKIADIVAAFEGEIVSLYMRVPHLTDEDFKNLGRKEHPPGPPLTNPEEFNRLARKARIKAMKAIKALREQA